MKRLLYFMFGVVTVVFGLSFAYKNAEVVALNYYYGLHWESPLSLMLLATLAIGIALGFVASLGMVVRMQRQLVRARREIREIEQEVTNLRALPIKDVL